MPLAPGTRLGPYEIVAQIGAGGMGEVYQARDPRLNRIVALKVSKDQFSERFEREAKAVAALNHPNICQLYDVGPNYLVMEFVDGAPLRGPLPIEEALRIAGQIALALQDAHAKGIVHRDLKPANILLKHDGTVKVLDFGLAKIGPTRGAMGEDPELSPTVSLGFTQAGVILGTAAYMSPEQARGKTATARSDIWAFGVVLYEVITGKRLFAGEDLTETLASVVKEQPDLTAAPHEVRRLLEACLQKDPRKRLQAIGDWGLLLDRRETSAAVPPVRFSAVGWVAAAIFTLVSAILAWIHFRENPPAREALQLSIPLPADSLPGFLTLSPDGRKLAVNLIVRGKGQIYVRSLDSAEFRLLEDTQGARAPFWSPDSRFIGFFADGKLKTIPAAGGPATTLCGETGLGGGGTWNRSGLILFPGEDARIRQVNASGSTCTIVNLGDETIRGGFPEFLPDGEHFLCTCVNPSDLSSAGIYLAKPGTKPRKILNDVSSALYAAAVSGKRPAHLLFLRGSVLMAQPFDAEKLQPLGDPVAVASPASVSLSPPQLAASVAANGTLVYLSAQQLQRQLVWFDRSGKQLEKAGEAGNLYGVSLSPDGTTVARAETSVSNPVGSSIVLFNLVRNSQSRLAGSSRFGAAPVWSPDGNRIAYSALDNTAPNLFVRNADGSGQDTALLPANPSNRAASDWSRDGRFLIYTQTDPKTRADIWYLPDPGKPGSQPVKFLATDAIESQAQLSPDGRWLAYYSNESGGNAVYVRAFPSGERQLKIADLAAEPRWGRNGAELFYLTITERPTHPALMVVSFKEEGAALPRIGSAQKLLEFEASRIVPQNNAFTYTPHPDGKRFLVNMNASQTAPQINVITNWQALLPVGGR